MIRRTTLSGRTFEFPSLADLLAKATPARSASSRNAPVKSRFSLRETNEITSPPVAQAPKCPGSVPPSSPTTARGGKT